jgi:hypothetical protein
MKKRLLTEFFLDANIIMYAAGKPSEYKKLR